MQVVARATDPTTIKTECLVVPVGSNSKLNNPAKTIDKATKGAIGRHLKSGDISGRPGSSLVLHDPEGIAAERLLLIGIGDQAPDTETFIKICREACKILCTLPIRSTASLLCQIKIVGRDKQWSATQFTRLLFEAGYVYRKTDDKNNAASKLGKVTLVCPDRTTQNACKKGAIQGEAIATGVNHARYLGDLPGNICTPPYLASRARALSRKYASIKTRVLSEKQMQELGMGALLSVAAGSKQPAHLIAMEYAGAGKSVRPIVLVGKGVTFDSGGISLKPGAKMDEMKYDMCGAASVFGVMEALAVLEPHLNVIGLVPTVENMPSGTATKPGDVVTSMSGKTIEVLNTDAEGRLILCDALTYAARYKPEVVVDIATLTGACVVALGQHASGLFANNQPLADELLQAGITAGDRAWQMPLWDNYDEELKSNFADIPNIGGQGAGSITAACFLGRFTKEYRWAPLDIAGTAWKSAAPKGATGRPVPLLMEFLLGKVA